MPRLPNFLIIVTDQQRSDSLGCYGAALNDPIGVDLADEVLRSTEQGDVAC